MKRLNNIYARMCSIENLRLADKMARRGKATQPGVMEFDKNPDANLLLLNESLINKTYKTSPYTIFKVYDPKEREIFRLPYCPDRITHWAVMLMLEKMFRAIFTADTYSCIKGKGIHGAVSNIKKALKDKVNSQFCLKWDITKFYPNINHEVLKMLLRRKIKDRDLLWLLDEIIDSAPGLPIGNYLSQYFANFYLTYFDHWVKEVLKVKDYFRYADDMAIFSSSKQQLHSLLAQIREYLSEKLKLTIKGTYQIFSIAIRGLDMLGYVFWPDHTFIRKRIKQKYARMLKRNRNPSSIASYHGWTKWADCIHLNKKLLYGTAN